MRNFKTLILDMEYLHPLEEGSDGNNHSFTIGMPFDMPRPSKVYKGIQEESLRGFYNGEKFCIREISPNIDYNIIYSYIIYECMNILICLNMNILIYNILIYSHVNIFIF